MFNNISVKQPCLIITRPLEQASELSRLCSLQGWHALQLPLLEIEQIVDNLQDLVRKQITYAFVVSPSAVEILDSYIDWHNPKIQWIAVGKSTADKIQAKTHRIVLYPINGHDSEALLKLPLWQERKDHIVIFKGDGGRDFLAKQLQQLGWQVESINIYRRKPRIINWSIFDDVFFKQYKPVILMTSHESVMSWFEQMPIQYCEKMKSLLYLSIHERISKTIRQYDVSNVINTQPGNENIIDSLRLIWE